MIRLITSGLSCNDWVGDFHPVFMPEREWLTFYAREINSCEVNSTITGVNRQSALFANYG